jgi:hypothetical protein
VRGPKVEAAGETLSLSGNFETSETAPARVQNKQHLRPGTPRVMDDECLSRLSYPQPCRDKCPKSGIAKQKTPRNKTDFPDLFTSRLVPLTEGNIPSDQHTDRCACRTLGAGLQISPDEYIKQRNIKGLQFHSGLRKCPRARSR